MKPPTRLAPVLSGVAGEYFVAAELSRRGYIASITLRNTRGIDILVSNHDATRSVGIQVKTTQSASWVLTAKAEVDAAGELAENLFYVFVRLNGLEAPVYHIVARKEIARHCRESHKRWLATPGRRGRQHLDNPMRKFQDPDGSYLNRWDILGLD